MSKTRRQYEKVISEAVQFLLSEQEGLPPMAQTPPPAQPPAAPPAQSQGGPPMPDAPAAPQTEQEKPLDVDKMISQLNIIRSGRSLSEPDIYQQLSAYHATIQPEERAILDKILQGIADVVVTQPETPPGPESGMEMQSGGPPQATPPTAPTPPPAPAAPAAPIQPVG